MGKIIKICMLLGLTIALFAGFATPINATRALRQEQDGTLAQQLTGTWRWETSPSWVVVFREDGTMVDGFPGFRMPYRWQVVNNRLIVDGIDWNVRVAGDTITVDRHGSRFQTHTYVWYSASTEMATSYWLLFVIFLGIPIFLAVVVVVVVILVVRARKRKQPTVPPPVV